MKAKEYVRGIGMLAQAKRMETEGFARVTRHEHGARELTGGVASGINARSPWRELVGRCRWHLRESTGRKLREIDARLGGKMWVDRGREIFKSIALPARGGKCFDLFSDATVVNLVNLQARTGGQ